LLAFYHSGVFAMRWRDIRFEKPTEADGDKIHREVIIVCKNGYRRTRCWQEASDTDVSFWMPLSELPDPPNRIPDPPEGWRWADKSKPLDKRAKFWHQYEKRYVQQSLGSFSTAEHIIYIVPIDPPKPPEPQYRPFANAAEFEPHRDRWIVNPGSGTYRRIELYGDEGAMGMSWEGLFRNRTFDDGSPFGVKVEP
jgi:hypothetical protein